MSASLEMAVSNAEIEYHRTKQNEINQRYNDIIEGAGTICFHPNENLGGFNNILTAFTKHKNVVGILGSADPAISAVAYGANKFDAVDLSQVACCHSELKLISLAFLNREQFIANGAVNYEIYSMIREALSDKTRTFFDNFFKDRSYTKSLVPQDSLESNLVPYIQNEEIYNLARCALMKIYIYNTNILKIMEESQFGSYDAAYLSNANTFIGREELKALISLLRNKLSEEGTFLITGTYDDLFNLAYDGESFLGISSANRQLAPGFKFVGISKDLDEEYQFGSIAVMRKIL